MVAVVPRSPRPPEPIPDFAYSWRPYSNPQLILRRIQGPSEDRFFAIDPWTQHWAIVDDAAVAVLAQANGRRRLAAIVRALRSSDRHPSRGVVAVAEELVSQRLLFDNKAAHQASGLPIYNKSDVTGLHLEITNACNMTCTHCYVSSGRKLPGELTLEEIFAAIDELPPFSGRRVAISGGEPAVRKDLLRIIDYCVGDCGHYVDLYTNGWKFPEKIARQLVVLNERHAGRIRVQMSLEGASEETNDAVRGRGAFQQALKSLEMFKTVGLSRATVLFVCLTKHNIGELEQLIELAEHHDVSALVFSQWQRQGNASDTPWATIAPSVEEWVQAGERLLTYDNPRLKVFGNFYGDLHNDEYGRFSLEQSYFPKHLYFYNSFPRIAPDGEIWADQLWVDRSWVLGNVKNDSLEDCFASPKFYDQLAQMRERIDSVAECQACDWRELCQCGSPGHTYAEYGHMKAKDLFCDSRIYWFERFVAHHVRQRLGPDARVTGAVAFAHA